MLVPLLAASPRNPSVILSRSTRDEEGTAGFRAMARRGEEREVPRRQAESNQQSWLHANHARSP